MHWRKQKTFRGILKDAVFLVRDAYEHIELPPYHSWLQAAGYFDGDGTTRQLIGRFVNTTYLMWSENYRPQLDQLQAFLETQGIPSDIVARKTAFELLVDTRESVLKAATNMLPSVSKKFTELEAIVKYFNNQITGNQFVEVFNKSVKQGNRTGIIRRSPNQPFTISQGEEMWKKSKTSNLILTRPITLEEKARIRALLLEGMTPAQVRKMTGISEATIFNIESALGTNI